ncbi:MAG: C39 family peptidase [Methanobacterium sp.]
MKIIKAILMMAVMIGVASLFATSVSAADQANNQLVVKDENADLKAVHQTTGQNESGNISKIDLNGAAKPEEVNAENSTTSKQPAKIDTMGVVMQSTSYNCGPAALATVLNNLGINTTEQELVNLAGTDESGTTMYGLVQAAHAKGVQAIWTKLSVNELKENDIVFLNISGDTHYSVIKEITNECVKLADPNLGNIEMDIDKFNEVYSNDTLVISAFNIISEDLNSSAENRANINSNDLQLGNNSTSFEKLQSIKGKGKMKFIVRFLKKGWVFISNISVVAWLLSIMPESWKNWFYGTINQAYANYKRNQDVMKKKYGMEFDPIDFCIVN